MRIFRVRQTGAMTQWLRGADDSTTDYHDVRANRNTKQLELTPIIAVWRLRKIL